MSAERVRGDVGGDDLPGAVDQQTLERAALAHLVLQTLKGHRNPIGPQVRQKWWKDRGRHAASRVSVRPCVSASIPLTTVY